MLRVLALAYFSWRRSRGLVPFGLGVHLVSIEDFSNGQCFLTIV